MFAQRRSYRRAGGQASSGVSRRDGRGRWSKGRVDEGSGEEDGCDEGQRGGWKRRLGQERRFRGRLCLRAWRKLVGGDSRPQRAWRKQQSVTAPVPDSCVTSVTSPISPQMAGKKQQQVLPPPRAPSSIPPPGFADPRDARKWSRSVRNSYHPSPRPQQSPDWLTLLPLAPDRPCWVLLRSPAQRPS